MGQQQLLLIVLGVMIIGIALVVAINLFQSQQDKSINVGTQIEGSYEDNGLGKVELYPDEASDITKALRNWRNDHPNKWEKVITFSYFEYDDKGRKGPYYLVIYKNGD